MRPINCVLCVLVVIALCGWINACLGDELSPIYPQVPTPHPMPVTSANRDAAAAFSHDGAVALYTWEIDQTQEARTAWILLSEIPRSPGVPEFAQLESMVMAAELRLIDAESNISAVMIDAGTITAALRDHYIYVDMGMGDTEIAWWTLEVAVHGAMSYVGGTPRTNAAEDAINTVLDVDVIACWLEYWSIIDSGFWGGRQ